jgi:hypothetical protein
LLARRVPVLATGVTEGLVLAHPLPEPELRPATPTRDIPGTRLSGKTGLLGQRIGLPLVSPAGMSNFAWPQTEAC